MGQSAIRSRRPMASLLVRHLTTGREGVPENVQGDEKKVAIRPFEGACDQGRHQVLRHQEGRQEAEEDQAHRLHNRRIFVLRHLPTSEITDRRFDADQGRRKHHNPLGPAIVD